MTASERAKKQMGLAKQVPYIDQKSAAYFKALQEEPKTHGVKKSPKQAFLNFKNKVLAEVSPAVAKDHLEIFEFEELKDGQMIIMLKDLANVQFVRTNLKAVLRTAFAEHLAPVATEIGFKVSNKKRPFIDGIESHRRKDKFLTADESGKVNSGVAGTADWLLGLFIDLYNSKKPDVRHMHKLIDGEHTLCFQIKTTYSGFGASRKPNKAGKRTVRQHFDRLLEIGYLIESDGFKSGGYHYHWFTFNPKLIAYKL